MTNLTNISVSFNGEITLLSPFTTSHPAKVAKGAPKPLPRMPVIEDGVPRLALQIPAGGLRGSIRHAAAEMVADIFKDRGEPIEFADWLLWSVGGAKGDDKEYAMSLAEMARILDQNPLLKLFGAGDSPLGRMSGGRIDIRGAIFPETVEVGVATGARRAENLNPKLAAMLEPEELEKVDDYTRGNAARSADKRKNGGQDESKKDGQDETGGLDAGLDVSSNSILRPLEGYEYIPMGAVAPHRMDLEGVTFDELGFFLAALERWAWNLRIGGHHAQGCGRIKADYAVTIKDNISRSVVGSGTIAIGDDACVLGGDWLNSALKAWKVRRADIDPNHLRRNPAA